MPDYSVRLEGDMVVFRNRVSLAPTPALVDDFRVHLDPDSFDKARQAAPGWDVRVLEQEWREWMTEPPRNPDAAFVGFCRKVYEKRDRP